MDALLLKMTPQSHQREPALKHEAPMVDCSSESDSWSYETLKAARDIINEEISSLTKLKTLVREREDAESLNVKINSWIYKLLRINDYINNIVSKGERCLHGIAKVLACDAYNYIYHNVLSSEPDPIYYSIKTVIAMVASTLRDLCGKGG